MKVALFDYGAGNLHSLKKALEAGGAAVTVTPSWEDALSLDALVLPGVGSFGSAVKALETDRERVRSALAEGLPTLGICLGMQLLFESSEEGPGQGIGLVPGHVRLLRSAVIPQMGWNDVTASGDPLFRDSGNLVAYFANSYVCDPRDPACVVATAEYLGDRFPAAVRVGRTWGVQFHPEKSSTPGLRLLRSFLDQARNSREGEMP